MGKIDECIWQVTEIEDWLKENLDMGFTEAMSNTLSQDIDMMRKIEHLRQYFEESRLQYEQEEEKVKWILGKPIDAWDDEEPMMLEKELTYPRYGYDENVTEEYKMRR